MTDECKQDTVLVIEDDAEVLNFASRLLELEGYRVLQAEDGDTGLILARESQPSLMLLDLKLPMRDGWDVLAKMRSELRLASIPVIVFTASAGALDRQKALGMGAADYVVKPISAVTLKEAVARILRRKG